MRVTDSVSFNDVMSASDDEFAYFLDPGVTGIDLESIPGLSAIPPPSQSSLQTLGDPPGPAAPRPSTPLVTVEDPNPPSSQYSFEEVDSAFLDELDKVEQRLLQSQEAGPSADRGEGPSTRSIAGGELTSRYFHGEHTSCVIVMASLIIGGWQRGGMFKILKVGNYISPLPLIIYCCPSVGNPDEDVKDENPNAKGSRGDILSPIPEPEVKSTEVVHEVPSPPTEGPSRKRRKGEQKESPRKILKEYLNNFEDEINCPMSGSEYHFDHKHILTFTILDAVTSYEGEHACIHDSGDMNRFTVHLPTWVTHAAILFAETVGGAGSGKTWVPRNVSLPRINTWQREAPSCLICRANLTVDAPMIPNFAVDSAVERHVQALRTSGVDGWESDGSKFTEWQASKE